MQPSAGTARHDGVAWGYASDKQIQWEWILFNTVKLQGFDVVGRKNKRN